MSVKKVLEKLEMVLIQVRIFRSSSLFSRCSMEQWELIFIFIFVFGVFFVYEKCFWIYQRLGKLYHMLLMHYE